MKSGVSIENISQVWAWIGYSYFFFNDTATTEIYTLSLHDALPIWSRLAQVSAVLGKGRADVRRRAVAVVGHRLDDHGDRKSTRLNSSHPSRSRMPSSAWKKKKQDLNPKHLHTTFANFLHSTP